MIQHIKYFIIPLLIFTSVSCQQSTKPAKEKPVKPANISTISVKDSRVFVFYKSFGFCNSVVNYFIQKEADDLYADKTFNIKKSEEKEIDLFSVLDEEKWNCLKENLNLQNTSQIKVVKTKEGFPFDNLLLINDKYLLVSRDGYFFIFEVKKNNETDEISSVNNSNTTKTYPSNIKGSWAVNCQNELTELDINKNDGFLSLYSPNAIYINLKVEKTSNENEYLLKFESTSSQKNYYSDMLKVIDEEISKDKVLGKLIIKKDGKAELHWTGLYNIKKKKLEFSGNDFLLIKENEGKTPISLEKCD